MDTAGARTADYWRDQIERALLAPIRAMRREYLPLLMVYFAYGAMGLTGGRPDLLGQEGRSPGRRRSSPRWRSGSPCRGPSRWCSASWSTPCRCLARSAAPTCSSAPAWSPSASSCWRAPPAAGSRSLPPDQLYVIAALLTVTGVVLQDVVADAMSTEVVPRTNPDGSPRPKAEIDHDLGMVQVLGRLALSFGIFAVAGLSGLAGAMALLRHGVPARPDRARSFRSSGALLVRARDQRAAADRLAHPGRRHRLRRGRGRCWR